MNSFIFHVKIRNSKYIGYLEADDGAKAKELILEKFLNLGHPDSVEIFGVTSKTFFSKNYENTMHTPIAMTQKQLLDIRMADKEIRNVINEGDSKKDP